MTVYDVFNPMENVKLQFTKEQVEDIYEWFDGVAKPLLTINNGEPVDVITIEQFMDFLKFKKFHRRNFHYLSYKEVMKEAENLKAGVLRVLSREQFIYILNKCVIQPEVKHELMLAWQVFDTEKRNFLEVDEIKNIVTTYGDIFGEEETREMLRDANVRGDGNVYYEDFVDTMFKLAPELFQLKVEYLYEDADKDPSVPPEPEPKPEPTAPPPPPPLTPPPLPPPPPMRAKGKKKK